jgi:hypothetical protein
VPSDLQPFSNSRTLSVIFGAVSPFSHEAACIFHSGRLIVFAPNRSAATTLTIESGRMPRTAAPGVRALSLAIGLGAVSISTAVEYDSLALRRQAKQVSLSAICGSGRHGLEELIDRHGQRATSSS